MISMHPGTLRRLARAAVDAAMRVFPVVVIRGPRQAGKSTLTSEIAEREPNRLLVSFDDPATRAQFRSDEDAFLRRGIPMIIDEAQREPAVMLALKRAVDDMGTKRVRGRYLVTGSANLLMMRQVGDSLTGRAGYVTLWPLTRRERLGRGTAGAWDRYLTQPVERWPEITRQDDGPPADWRDEVLQGRFPEPAYALTSPVDRATWSAAYVQTYLDRDLRDVSTIENSVAFHDVMRAAAIRLGNLTNQTEIGRDVQMSQPRVRSYLDLLEISYQIVRLPAAVVTPRRRLIKTPKLYWNDPALAMHLTGETEPRGAHFENVVLLDLLAWAGAQRGMTQIGYWRTAAGAEVDFVAETATRLLPIEIKTSAKLYPADAQGLRALLEEQPKRAPAGLILYSGNETFWLADRVLAVPWWKVI